jgi:hypothetical protein
MVMGSGSAGRRVASSGDIHTVSTKGVFNSEPELARLADLYSNSEFGAMAAGIK